ARGRVDSRGVDGLARVSAHSAGCEHGGRSDLAPTGDDPGAGTDARRRARYGHNASGALAEAGRRRVWARGAVRDESQVGLGLRARADTAQPTDALAGSALR